MLTKKQIHNIFQEKKQMPKHPPLGVPQNTEFRGKPKIKIIIDHRERNSFVPTSLLKLGLEIEFKELKVADYIVNEIAIERKTINDFLSSMINRHLVNQLDEMQQYEKKLLIIEGIEQQELYNDNNPRINANAVRGFLLSITLKHNIPIIFTKNPTDTAKFINVLANKKQTEKKLNPIKKTLNKKQQLQYIIESFPSVGPKTAKKLLKEFKTIQNIINAPKENLEKILGKKINLFLELIERKY